MTEKQLLERITVNPKVMVGKPVIKGTRLTVEYILGLWAHGATFEEILQEYPGLTREDFRPVCSSLQNHWKALSSCPLLESRPKCSLWGMNLPGLLLRNGFVSEDLNN